MPAFKGREQIKDAMFEQEMWVLQNITRKGHIIDSCGFSRMYEAHIWFLWNVSLRNIPLIPMSPEDKKEIAMLEQRLGDFLLTKWGVKQS